ncbi:hypothetical protein ACN38_g2062 [Penicillium nordicum]|uniref:Uncharacterized protein n=1 Tax=Penicillium nordicum TaxID=229535 RepID=A0A0M9WJ89_9EURO|nr:hypothetical protein ACN38_g2062 [Penicillium nordicum]
MSVSQSTTSELPYYCKVDSITDTTITYRMLFFKPNVKQESKKYQSRIHECCMAVWMLTLIVFVQTYCLARYFLASMREGWELKGRGYDLAVGPAHTYTFDSPLAYSGLNVPLPSKDSNDVHVSGHIEKV